MAEFTASRSCVGCGLGHDAREFAKKVGTKGLVSGIYLSEKLLNEAKKRSKDFNNIDYTHGDVNKLKFDNDTFSSAYSERVFMHIENPEKPFSEMLRATKPGGKIVIVDTDMAFKLTY